MDHYLDHLAARGVDAPSTDQARLDIRNGILHGFYLWSITTMVDPAITATMLERMGPAATDHDVLGAIYD